MMLRRLAVALGMTLAEVGARMDSAELSEWMAFDEIYDLVPPAHARAVDGLGGLRLVTGAAAARGVESMTRRLAARG